MFYIKQVIVRLDDDIHRKLKLKTIQDDVSIQGLIEEFVNLYINTDETALELLSKVKK